MPDDLPSLNIYRSFQQHKENLPLMYVGQDPPGDMMAFSMAGR